MWRTSFQLALSLLPPAQPLHRGRCLSPPASQPHPTYPPTPSPTPPHPATPNPPAAGPAHPPRQVQPPEGQGGGAGAQPGLGHPEQPHQEAGVRRLWCAPPAACVLPCALLPGRGPGSWRLGRIVSLGPAGCCCCPPNFVPRSPKIVGFWTRQPQLFAGESVAPSSLPCLTLPQPECPLATRPAVDDINVDAPEGMSYAEWEASNVSACLGGVAAADAAAAHAVCEAPSKRA